MPNKNAIYRLYECDDTFINAEVPLPTADTVVVAGYAAVSAVAVTTFAQPFFDTIKKKLQKLLQGKIDKWKKRKKD